MKLSPVLAVGLAAYTAQAVVFRNADLELVPDLSQVEDKEPEDPQKTSEAQGLYSRYQQMYSQRVRNVFSTLNSPAVLTVSGGIDRMFMNYVLTMDKMAKATGKSVVVVNAMLTAQSLNTCRSMQPKLVQVKVECIDLVGMLSGITEGKRGYTGSYLWAKPVVFVDAVRASPHGVLVTDLDVIFHKDLLGWVEEHWASEPNVLLTTGTEWQTCCNSGTVYATKRSMPLLDLWLDANHRWYQRKLGDQDALHEIIQYNVSQLGVSVSFPLPFPQEGTKHLNYTSKKNTSWISLFPETVVKQQCRKCRSCPRDCHGCPDDTGPWAVHYNCINTHMNPSHTLSTRGNWTTGLEELSTSGQLKAMQDGGDWCVAEDRSRGLSAGSTWPRGGVTWTRNTDGDD